MKKKSLIILVLILTSCLTKNEIDHLSLYQFFPENSFGYGYIDCQENAEIIKSIILKITKNNFLQEYVVGHTQHILIGLNQKKNSETAINIILVGAFSSNQLNTALLGQKNKGWVQVNSKKSYWNNSKLEIQVASPLRGIIFISTDLNFNVLDSFSKKMISTKKEDLEIFKTVPLAFLITDLKPLFSSESNQNFNLPIEQLSLFATLLKKDYFFHGTIQFDSQSAARIFRPTLMSLLNLKLFRLGLSNSIYNKNLKFNINESVIDISGLKITKKNLSKLMSQFITPREEKK